MNLEYNGPARGMRLFMGLAGTIVILSGCAPAIQDMSCDDVEAEAVAISDGGLIKIMGGRETSRTETELICHGTGIYSSNEEVRTRYKAYVDAEGEEMVAFDTDEADAHEAQQVENQYRQEAEQAQREFEREVERLTSEF